jgi:hypothetical protein
MSMAEVRLALEEIALALDCALAAGERLAGHQIIPSTSFDSLLEHLRSAQEAIEERGRQRSPRRRKSSGFL